MRAATNFSKIDYFSPRKIFENLGPPKLHPFNTLRITPTL